MKNVFNQVRRQAVFMVAAACLILTRFPESGAAAPVGAAVKQPDVILLAPGVSGGEIQQALDSLPASGGEVVLPPGNISIRQPIVLRRSFQTLSGSGAATILRLADDANCPVIILGEPINNPKHTIRCLCVRDLFIDGNRAHQQRELWRLTGEGSEIRNNGITVQGVADSLVENVTAAACRSGGVVTTRSVRRLTVRGLEAFGNQFDGLACYQTEDSFFTDLNLHDNPCAGISLDLAFNHNVVSNAVLNANDLGVFMRSSRDNQFFNVSIHASRHLGVFIAQAIAETASGHQPAPETDCTYNSFTNLSAFKCGGPAFRVNDYTCTNNILIRAKFDGNQGNVSEVLPDLVMLR